ncbi:GerAB/ArcD/ProY family transporter [Risungbinella massiliensis]|uniref:GerAB/ArcD/ProY family transporter n=1 Tax=Risungbinella massiliensis TaxID=1329796 RepID=UPI0005CBB880|nr:endospore germination permease [Risungbinella massiliensis]
MKVRYPEDYRKGTIGPLQAFSISYQNVLGVGVLFMPATVAASTQRSGIFSILLMGFFCWIIVSVVTWGIKRYPQMSLWEIGTQVFGTRKNPKVGKWLFAPIFILLMVNWLMYIAVEISLFVTTLKIEYFTQTPNSVLIVLSLLLSMYAAKQGPATIARLNVLLLPVTVIPLLLFLFSTFEGGELINIIPTLPDDWGAFFSGSLNTLFSFAGFTIFLGYIGFYRRPDKSGKAHSWAVWAITFWYVLTYIFCLSVFGPEDISNYLTPVLSLVTESQSDQFLIERLDPAFLPAWMVMVFTTTSNSLFAVSYAMKEFLGVKEETRGTIIFILSSIAFVIAMLPTDLSTFNEVLKQYQMITWSISIPFTLICALFAVIRKRGRKGEHDAPVS